MESDAQMTDIPLPPALPKRKTLRNSATGRGRIAAALISAPFDIYRDEQTGALVLRDASWERVRFWVMEKLDARVTKRHFDSIVAGL